MPTFVIHELKKLARKASLGGKTLRIGRDPSCELVLTGAAVSREHAVFQQDGATGNWFVYNRSQTNPLVVDGKLVSESAWVQEGSEILVGVDHLLIFSETEQKAATYFQAGRVRFDKKHCARCDWTGMVSGLREDPPCPRCGATGMTAADAYVAQIAKEESVVETRAMDLDAVRASLKQLKAAKRSHIERADGYTGGGSPRQDLSETEPLVLSRSSELRLRGFVFGSVTVSWNGRRWMASSNLMFGALRVNGEPTKGTALKHGDVLDIGPNQFKVVTE